MHDFTLDQTTVVLHLSNLQVYFVALCKEEVNRSTYEKNIILIRLGQRAQQKLKTILLFNYYYDVSLHIFGNATNIDMI